MKRSNRLVLLIGVVLAIVAFFGIVLLLRNPQGSTDTTIRPPTTATVVVAKANIPLSTRILADQVTTAVVPLDAVLTGSFTDPSQIIGQIVRQPIASGAQITSTALTGGATGTITNLTTPPGQRSIAIQVDQVSGVGTVIKPGDHVDMIIGLTGDKFPVITISPTDSSVTVVSGLNSTSVKVLIQGMQVLGTLLPPAETSSTGTASAPPTSGGTTTLNGQSEIVILAVTAQQAEVIKFTQLDSSITLVLRSPDDFIDPVTGAPLTPISAKTTGVILKTLVDSYGVLPPEVVQTVTPTSSKKP